MTGAINAIVAQINAIGLQVRLDVPPGLPEPLVLRCIVFPQLVWDVSFLERELALKIPPELRELWDSTSCLGMFLDVTYGQSGLVVWSPDQALVRHRRYSERRPDDFRSGDLIIGEFLGDSDLLIVRCDPRSEDFGSVMIALPLDERSDWEIPARSLSKFFRNLLDTEGRKYWELDL
jgi:hypothetical protein